jgi:hypothetical protein
MASTYQMAGKAATKISRGVSAKSVLGIGALTIGGMGLGVARGDPIQHTMNSMQEAMFDTDQVDNMILGTDLAARNFVGLPFGMQFKAGSSAAGGAVLGGGLGAVLGRGKAGRLVGGLIGAGVGAVAGGALGALNSDTGRILFPRDNPADMFSGRTFNKTPFNYLKVDESQIANMYQNTAASNFENGYSRYPGSTYPQRMMGSQWNSATGDIVLGSYNLRRG